MFKKTALFWKDGFPYQPTPQLIVHFNIKFYIQPLPCTHSGQGGVRSLRGITKMRKQIVPWYIPSGSPSYKQGGVISPRWITKMRGRLIPVGDLPAWIGCPNNLELWIFLQGFNLHASNDPGMVGKYEYDDRWQMTDTQSSYVCHQGVESYTFIVITVSFEGTPKYM